MKTKSVSPVVLRFYDSDDVYEGLQHLFSTIWPSGPASHSPTRPYVWDDNKVKRTISQWPTYERVRWMHTSCTPFKEVKSAYFLYAARINEWWPMTRKRRMSDGEGHGRESIIKTVLPDAPAMSHDTTLYIKTIETEGTVLFICWRMMLMTLQRQPSENKWSR